MSYRKSDHYDGKKFFNTAPVKAKTFWDVVKWQFREKKKAWPRTTTNTATPRLQAAGKANEINITFINHATFLLQFQRTNVLIDPVFAERVSPLSFLGPKRVRPPGVAMDNLPPIHLVLITHNHYDHLDLTALKQLRQKFQPRFLVPLADKKLLAKEGIENIAELDWWETFTIDEPKNELKDELEIHFTPAQHWSARGFRDRCDSLWGGFYLKTPALNIFWAGDTGYSSHFRQIAERLGAPQLAFFPVGCYEPRWFMKDMHMNPAEAVRAHLDMQPRLSIGMHFGTFRLTDEGIDDPLKDLAAAKTERDVDNFITLKEGESKLLTF